MSPAQDEPLRRVRYRAPTDDRSIFIEPGWRDIERLLAGAASLRAAHEVDVAGKPLAQLARQGRHELLAAALAETRSYCDVAAPESDTPLIMAGHQPELFHPGVWVKNFAIAGLAQRARGVAVNLVIDGDTLKWAGLRVPSGSIDEPAAVAVPIDAPADEVPFEERTIRDAGQVRSFGRRAAETIAPLVRDPLLTDFWPLVIERTRHSRLLGECLAQARRQWESRWGAEALECTQGQMCQLPSFRWFVVHVLVEIERFREVYNAAVDEYRRVNRIRSTSHPVPNLAADNGWLEAPFWCWQAAAPRRKRLFVRRSARELILSDGRDELVRLPLDGAPATEASVAALAELERRGIKIRSRALATTLFARLVLGDLFIHGIGGAKYDQITDSLIRRFFGLCPPPMAVLSATLRLPIERDRVAQSDLLECEQSLRELDFHPERALDATAAIIEPRVAELMSDKAAWIAADAARFGARARCQAIRRINELLRPCVAERRARLESERDRLRRRMRGEAVLASREYAFCLYPEQTLRDFFLAIHAGKS